MAKLLDLLGYERYHSRGGFTHSGGARDSVTKQLLQRDISTDHWKNPLNRSFTGYLVLKDGVSRPDSNYLRQALIELGIPYACADPGHIPDPRGLPLDVEHINGNYSDCRKENLEFLCSNCHSLRATSSKSRGMKSFS